LTAIKRVAEESGIGIRDGVSIIPWI